MGGESEGTTDVVADDDRHGWWSGLGVGGGGACWEEVAQRSEPRVVGSGCLGLKF